MQVRSVVPGWSLGVGPVQLPDVLDRPQIVTRPAPNRIDMNEFQRWGGNMNQDMQRVLVQDLMAQLDSDQVFSYPWAREGSPLYRVTVRFFNFDGRPGEMVRLAGTWQLFEARKSCLIVAHSFDIQETPADKNYSGYVNALSHGLAQLSQTIAAEVAETGKQCVTAE